MLLVCVETSFQRCESCYLRKDQTIGFSNLLQYCWSLWKKDDDEQRKKEAEQDSLYMFKTKTHHISCADGTEEQKEIEDIFPPFHVFDDKDEESHVYMSDQPMDESSSVVTNSLKSFLPEELHKMCCLHLSVFGNASKRDMFKTLTQPPSKTYHLASYLLHYLQNLPGKCRYNNI